MDFKQAKINWQDILKNSTSWILYSFYDWRKLITSDDSQNIDWAHGKNSSPTYARSRIITLEWVSDRIWKQSEEQSNIDYLQNIFALQGDLFELEKKELYIKDSYDNEWVLDVKIKEPLEIVEWDENSPWSYYRWRVVLESTKDPVYKSYNEILTTWEEWDFGWFYLDFEFWNDWISFEEVSNILECNQFWNMSSSLKFEITAKNDVNAPLKIINLTDNTFFALNIDAVLWDVIVINWNNFTATKNWENILADRVSWSIWQKIKWNAKFIIEDKDWWIENKDIDIKIYFNNSLL